MSINDLVELSRLYGGNSEYVLAGGGNTSWKDDKTLFVKASGFSLAEADEESFVKMDRKALAGIWEKTYPSSDQKREREVLSSLMASRAPDEKEKRPSVETLLHDIIPFSFVVHLHPALVNGLCCSVNGEQKAKELFGDEAVWIPSTNPGYVLSCFVKGKLEEYRRRNAGDAHIILLQNHGVFVGENCKEGIISIYDNIMSKICSQIKRHPDFSGEKIYFSGDNTCAADEILRIFQTMGKKGLFCGFLHNAEIEKLIKDASSFFPVSSAFTPDHIVYSGSNPLFTESKTGEKICAEMEDQKKKTGLIPKIIAVKDLGIFSAAPSLKGAKAALELFLDTVKVAVYTESFTGPLFMEQDKIDFINNWEVERFRSAISVK